MALQFQPFGNPFAKQQMEQEQYNQLNQTLGGLSNQFAQGAAQNEQEKYRQQEMVRQLELMDMERKKFKWQEDEQNRLNTITPVSAQGQDPIDIFKSSYSLTQRNPNAKQQGQENPFQNPQMAMQQPAMGMPQNRTSLFQGGQGQPQVASDLVAMHKQQFPQYANMSGGQMGGGSQPPGMPPPGYSPRTYEESLKNRKLAADAQQSEAHANWWDNGGSAGIKSGLIAPEGNDRLRLEFKYGKAPTSYRWTESGDLEPIPNGPAATKLEKLNEKDASLRKGQIQKADLIIKKVDQALGKVSPFTTGMGSYFSSIPGTSAKNLKEDIKTIQANLGFQQLQEMRANSPTGGALGQVSDREIGLLTSAVASLDQAQDDKQLIERLNEIKDSYSRWRDAVYQSLQQTDGASVQSNKIRVRSKQNGKTGTISEQYFDANKYERL